MPAESGLRSILVEMWPSGKGDIRLLIVTNSRWADEVPLLSDLVRGPHLRIVRGDHYIVVPLEEAKGLIATLTDAAARLLDMEIGEVDDG